MIILNSIKNISYRYFSPINYFSLLSKRRLTTSISLNEKMVEVNVDKKNQPTVVLLTAEHLKTLKEDVKITQADKTFVKLGDNTIEGENAVSRYLARVFPNAGLYGSTPLENSQVDSWLDFSTLYLKNSQDINDAVQELNKSLSLATFLVGHNFTIADFAIWSSLQGNSKWASVLDKGTAGDHLARWFKFCTDQGIFKAVSSKVSKPASNTNNKGNGKKDDSKDTKTNLEEGGRFIDLPGAEMGKVVTRFPPEASGYLHIGHAKAALLNQTYKEMYNGKLIMRFDDTNPAKENQHFEDIILEDIKMLQLTPDIYSRTSDHFEKIQDLAEQLIKQGDAYCDCTPSEEMRKLREEKQSSAFRNQTPEEALRLFGEMKKGSAEGLTNCLRAKLDYSSDNGCLRDPVLYRCRDEAHITHGDRYKAYPTYDFACPVVDSVEGVTHALRTSEYLDRDDQYYWIIDKLALRKPFIYSYSRLNLVNTVLSKRKLAYLVDEGIVDGWDDPRFPTVRGVLRKGLTIPGLKEFIKAQGASKSNVTMGWDKIWSFNKKMIDPVAPRFNALLKNEVVLVNVKGATESSTKYPKHPKNEDIGEKNVYYSDRVLIEGEDAKLVKEGELVTFINWGNLRIEKINKDGGDNVTSIDAVTELDNKDFKKTTKVTWLAQHSKAPFVPTTCVFFDNIITKDVLSKEDNFKDYIGTDTKKESVMLGDPELNSLKKGDIIQIQRRGYFICDEPYQPASRYSGRESQCVLFHIPDGSTSGMMNTGKDKKTGGLGGSNSSSTARLNKKQAKGTSSQKSSTASLSSLASTPSSSSSASGHTSEQQKLYDSVTAQGDKIRTLKSEKAAKDVIVGQVGVLKKLKEDYKQSTGREYTAPTANNTSKAPEKKAVAAQATTSSVSHTPAQQKLYDSVTAQGDKIRSLKSEKATKDVIVGEVGVLKKLKEDYKQSTGREYTAPTANNTSKGPEKKAVAAQVTTSSVSHTPEQQKLYDSVTAQGDKIRTSKSEKAAKDVILAQVDVLKKLKASYKASTGVEYTAGKTPAAAAPQNKAKEMAPVATTAISPEAEQAVKSIVQQGDKIRELKSQKATKDTLQPEIDLLLKYKADYKSITGTDYQAPGGAAGNRNSKKKENKPPQEKKEKKPKEKKPKAAAATTPTDDGQKQKQTRLGVEFKKNEALSDWYSQVITKSEMIEYYDVSGCYILREWSYGIWERIVAHFDKRIKDSGVKNCYFPMFVSNSALEKEKEHIADFAPEYRHVNNLCAVYESNAHNGVLFSMPIYKSTRVTLNNIFF